MKSDLPTVLAAGAWLKNAACLLESGVPLWSAVHGDLSDPRACIALDASLRSLVDAAKGPITAVAHDLHPDFYSTRLAITLAGELQVPAIGVQHHHAHIAAVMAEHDLRGPVIGLALDGVGLGTDGGAWGGELLWVDQTSWKRLGHLWPLHLPGGDVAAREPWRMAAAALHALGRDTEIGDRFSPSVGASASRTVQQMLASGLNCPPTSSTGRWFDAAAGALKLSVRQSHEAEAAIALEHQAKIGAAIQNLPPHGGLPPHEGLIDASQLACLDLRPLLDKLLDWPESDASLPQAAAWFHYAFADALADWAEAALRETGARCVCLGGGCFYNAVLTERLTARLQQRDVQVLRPLAHSCGDAGLALGQAWVAAQAVRMNSSTSVSNESLPCV